MCFLGPFGSRRCQGLWVAGAPKPLNPKPPNPKCSEAGDRGRFICLGAGAAFSATEGPVQAFAVGKGRAEWSPEVSFLCFLLRIVVFLFVSV